MFEKQLEEAARRSRLQIILIFAGILAVALIVAAFLLFQALDKSNRLSVQGEMTIAEPTQPTPSAVKPVRPSETSPPLQKDPLPSDEPVRSQREVLDLMGRYDQEFEKTVLSEPFETWNPDQQQTLRALKKEVVDQLARGDVDKAFDDANQLLEQASAAISEYNMAFQTALQAAKDALAADNFEEANAAINQALNLKPDNEEAVSLREAVDKLEDILPLIKRAQTAAIENDFSRERDLSQQIYQLDPSRVFYKNRAAEITRLLKERAFEDVIASGLSAATKEDLAALKKATEMAQELYSKREETKELVGRFLRLQQELQFREFVARADQAVQSENWETALFAFQNALQLKPNDGTIAQGVELARTILGHEARLNAFLNKPERLTNNQVKSDAETALKEAETYLGLSKKLAASSTYLKKRIVDYNRLVDIWVISDKATDVSVRGVGQVGQVERYKIQLKPGRYILEGRREGYRVKAVEMEILPNDQFIEIKVICDERI